MGRKFDYFDSGFITNGFGYIRIGAKLGKDRLDLIVLYRFLKALTDRGGDRRLCGDTGNNYSNQLEIIAVGEIAPMDSCPVTNLRSLSGMLATISATSSFRLSNRFPGLLPGLKHPGKSLY